MEVSEEHVVCGEVSKEEFLLASKRAEELVKQQKNIEKEEKRFCISKASRAILCKRLRGYTEVIMGIHKGTRWAIEDKDFEEFMKCQQIWLDFLEGK